MLQARVSDLRRIIDRAEEQEDMPIYIMTSEGTIYPISREGLLGGIISVVGPVPQMKMPTHLMIKYPPER